MRVALIHNFYRSSAPSGEDEVVRSERQLLEANGIEVVTLMRHNDDLPVGVRGAVGASLSNAWSFASSRALRRLLEEHRPDVAHFHNTFPQISPAAYYACNEAGVPVVQTLHNYRMFCANGILSRAGKPCESCLGRVPLPALIHGCYRGSRIATAGMVLGSALHRARGTFESQVSRYVALTDFARDRFVAHGISPDRIVVRGNSLPADPGVGAGDGGYALFVGRLCAEKGLSTLVRAWRRTSDIPLRIAGDGELRGALERDACDLPIEFLGRVSPSRVLELMQNATMLIVPSEWYEGFPRVVVEAFATGTPIVAADIGGLAELVDDSAGIRFTPGDSSALATAVMRLWREPGVCAEFRRANRRRFETRHSPHAAISSLREIYSQAIQSDAALAPPSGSASATPGAA